MRQFLHPALAAVIVPASLAAGAYVARITDRAVYHLVADKPLSTTILRDPFASAGALLLSARARMERPDAQLWALAPALVMALAAVGLALIPLGPGAAAADPAGGFVLFSAAVAYVMIGVYLHGWSANAAFPLLGGYRFVAQALSYQMPFLLALLAPVLPAESFSIVDLVGAQESLWNVIRQPLGLPIYLIVASGVSFTPPLDLPDATDVAGGTAAEVSGPQRLVWNTARGALQVTVAAMGASAFLGGWWGPLLPGWLWVIVKTLAILVVMVAARHLVARLRIETFVVFSWTVLLPLSLVNIFFVGGTLL